ncbi:Short-chain dehydrogenase/reductase SDR [Fulvimarina pelagi HTCC2506]|uniref:Short-chain dehydrogenase/reductase SDR n=2 Tax=Fulvimarina pelagi TaxID=217511 RepID=Q0FZA6_9HYPH|nr:SDR family NAD(P)-dependent oxidoreductase [Fulvimarina pelagi]EAU40372.1 Short-chain dehydrogenase/reductase SDR [Fulvimarina pelagi HTCC2506]BAT31409.1 short-chain dehydrogenase/reductase SDR [Fulvimarina pelagi]
MALALIVGVGDGLSASLARKLAARGYSLILAARDTGKLEGLAGETGATTVQCDAALSEDMDRLFEEVDAGSEDLAVAIYNPSARTKGALVDLDPTTVRTALDVTAFGAFLMAQQAARRMVRRQSGTILFTGASAGVKGFPRSAPFAMGKFALRGLAQSMARELHPQGVHVGHVVVDGSIGPAGGGSQSTNVNPDAQLDPDAIAETYLSLIDQPRSAWAWEIELRPWVETF